MLWVPQEHAGRTGTALWVTMISLKNKTAKFTQGGEEFTFFEFFKEGSAFPASSGPGSRLIYNSRVMQYLHA